MATLPAGPTRWAFEQALSEWNSTEGIRWTRVARDWVLRHLEISLREFGRRLHEYVARGGEVDAVRETRAHWRELHQFHYDLRLTIDDAAVYVETRLIDDSRVNPPHILIVNVHEQ